MRRGIVVRNEAALKRRAKEIRFNRKRRRIYSLQEVNEALSEIWVPELRQAIEQPSSLFSGFMGIKCYKISSQGGPDEQPEGEETTEQLPQ